MSPITCHVLDTALGRPAAGVPILLARQRGKEDWQSLAQAHTDADGRVRNLVLTEPFVAGVYRVTFDTKAYLEANQRPVFFPHVDVVFLVERPEEHFHIPLLLSPFGYSTYRGS
jgi:5-hydroxyisourate hydrolase